MTDDIADEWKHKFDIAIFSHNSLPLCIQNVEQSNLGHRFKNVMNHSLYPHPLCSLLLCVLWYKAKSDQYKGIGYLLQKLEELWRKHISVMFGPNNHLQKCKPSKHTKSVCNIVSLFGHQYWNNVLSTLCVWWKVTKIRIYSIL